MNHNKDNLFLNNLNDLSRDMYSVKQQRGPLNNDPTRSMFQLEKHIPKKDDHRFDTDMLLNNKDIIKNKERDKDKLIIELNKEIKQYKQKMEFVIEKDKEIYELKCKNELLSKESSHEIPKTDESLIIENRELQERIESLQNNITELQSENNYLQTIISQLSEKSSIVSFNIDTFKQSLSKRLQSYHEKQINTLIQKYNIQDKSTISKQTVELFIKELLN